MRQLLATTFLTLDGVMQAPGGQGEDPSNGFAHEGWSVTYWDEVMGQAMGAVMTPPFDLVLGRKTYDIFAAHWPNASEEEGAGPLNAATKYVASRGKPQLSWENSVLLEGDVAQAVAALKVQDGPQLQVHGSSELLHTLLKAGLVDEFHLLTFPVIVGGGKRLFAEGIAPAGLKLLDTTTSSTGVIISRYQPIGEVRVGTFALED